MPILYNSNTTITFEFLADRINSLTRGLTPLVNTQMISIRAHKKLSDTITEDDLDDLLANEAASMTNIHPDFALMGGRILTQKLQRIMDVKNRTFTQNLLRHYNQQVHGVRSNRVSDKVMDFVLKYEKELQEIINYEKEFEELDIAAVHNYTRRCLEKVDGVIGETVGQRMLRVAVGLNIWVDRDERELAEFERIMGFKANFDHLKNQSDVEKLQNIKEYYNVLADRDISVPGPILMHAGSVLNQMSSCYLQYCSDTLTGMSYHVDGKVEGIMKAMTQLAAQSKGAGGNAISLHDLRSAGSPLRQTGGKSNGILPFMKMFDATIGAIDQSGKRAGTCAVYLEPWHADIRDFLDAADHFTIEEKRCKNLFFGLWANDLFFERLVNDKGAAKWTLFDPAQVLEYLDKPLSEYYGEDFKEKYIYLESLNIGESINLMEIWARVCKLMQISGNPYIVNKDQINLKSNSKSIGMIKSSNLCTEVALPANENETGVCVLTSINLLKMYNSEIEGQVDYQKIISTARIATRHLNNVIDLQYYPTPETRNGCLARRAIGIGAQGLADLLAKLKLDFDSPEAKIVNKRVYEAIYFGSLLESTMLAKRFGSYQGFESSPVNQGILQYDMWNLNENDLFLNNYLQNTELGDEPGTGNAWTDLKRHIQKFGLRNSEVTALMPTANSSIRMGTNEMHEPFTRNVYVRQYIGGSIQVVNRHLVRDLLELNLWSENLCHQIITNEGSVQGIATIPADIQRRYRTSYELDYKDLIDMMADRAPFVSQTSSFNHFVTYNDAGPTAFTQRIIYAWKKGLKTLSYYIHTETASTGKKELGGIASKTTAPDKEPVETKVFEDGTVCSMEEGCEVCSS